MACPDHAAIDVVANTPSAVGLCPEQLIGAGTLALSIVVEDSRVLGVFALA